MTVENQAIYSWLSRFYARFFPGERGGVEVCKKRIGAPSILGQDKDR